MCAFCHLSDLVLWLSSLFFAQQTLSGSVCVSTRSTFVNMWRCACVKYAFVLPGALSTALCVSVRSSCLLTSIRSDDWTSVIPTELPPLELHWSKHVSVWNSAAQDWSHIALTNTRSVDSKTEQKLKLNQESCYKYDYSLLFYVIFFTTRIKRGLPELSWCSGKLFNILN